MCLSGFKTTNFTSASNPAANQFTCEEVTPDYLIAEYKKLFGESATFTPNVDNAYPCDNGLYGYITYETDQNSGTAYSNVKSSCAGIVSKVNDSQHYCLDCKAAENGYYAPMYTAAQLADGEKKKQIFSTERADKNKLANVDQTQCPENSGTWNPDNDYNSQIGERFQASHCYADTDYYLKDGSGGTAGLFDIGESFEIVIPGQYLPLISGKNVVDRTADPVDCPAGKFCIGGYAQPEDCFTRLLLSKEFY